MDGMWLLTPMQMLDENRLSLHSLLPAFLSSPAAEAAICIQERDYRAVHPRERL